jgi:hypothetical protein
VGQKTVRFSDLSGQLITDDDTLVRIVVQDHPALAAGPVELEVLADEAAAVEKAAQPVAVVDLFFPGGDEPRRLAVETGAFDSLATDKPMAGLLAAAPPARRTARPAGASPARAARPDYTTIEHAGTPHRGKITDAEKRLVREHLAQINERLAAQGLRPVSLADTGHVERYGLEQLAAASGPPEQSPAGAG